MIKKIIPIIFVFAWVKAQSQTWIPLGAGVNGEVLSLAADPINQKVHVGGFFFNASNVPVYNCAEWNGSNWQSMDTISSYISVYSMVFFQNDLYGGGGFGFDSNSIQLKHLAKFDNSKWNGIDGFLGGLTGEIYALAVDTTNNVLYAAGDFVQFDTLICNHIISWDGFQWLSLGAGTNGRIYSLFLDSNGYLYAGGDFNIAGNISVNNIALWNGINWIGLGQGLGNRVNTIKRYKDKIYAGGQFNRNNGQQQDYLACWNGIEWAEIAGINNSVYTLEVYAGELYVGGRFSFGGTRGIGKWNGNEFSSLTQGLDFVSIAETPVVSSFALLNEDLYVGGYFETAGSILVNNIAKWSMPVSVEQVEETTGFSINPNPLTVENEFYIQRTATETARLLIYDAKGLLMQTVYLSVGEMQKSFSVSDQTSKGVYFYQYLQGNENNVKSGKLIVIK